MQYREGTLAAQDGTALYTQSWLPSEEARGVLVIAHGLAEHSGRYELLAARLVRAGFAVHALDHRGHGRSPGRRANIDRFDSVVADLRALIDTARDQHPGRPVILLGHSMGGAIALTFALRSQEAIAGLVLSAPAVGVSADVPRLQVLAARWLSVLAPNAGVLKLPAEALSRDPMVVRAYVNDPLVYTGSIPARTLAELLAAMQAFPATVGQLRIPVLVLHGTGDTLVPLADCMPVYERMGSPDRSVRTYPELYHEVFNEPERETVIADLLAWLDTHT